MNGQPFQTTLTFVDSVSEVYSALLAAKPLVVFPKKVTRNVEAFMEGLESTGITRLFAVTSLIRGILSVLRMEKKRGTETNNIRLKKVGGAALECSMFSGKQGLSENKNSFANPQGCHIIIR